FNRLKEISDVLDLMPVLTDELLELGKWLAEHTLSLYITAYQAMPPHVLKATYKKELIRNTENRLSEELETLFSGRDVIPYDKFIHSTVPLNQLQQAIQDGDVSVNYLVKSKATKKYVTMIEPKKTTQQLVEALLILHKNATSQRRLLQTFIRHLHCIEHTII